MTKDLTTGKIMPILIRFTIPLVLGNLFQLTYNAVDSIIVGHFVGKEALAAVGICNPISTLMILFLNGLCMGASILMGMQYGAKDYDTLHRQKIEMKEERYGRKRNKNHICRGETGGIKFLSGRAGRKNRGGAVEEPSR